MIILGIVIGMMIGAPIGVVLTALCVQQGERTNGMRNTKMISRRMEARR